MQRRGRKRNCLVYDLGGGTFDVTVLAIDDNELNVLSIGGDHHLGGKDFDDRIMNFFEEQVKLKHDIDISEIRKSKPNCASNAKPRSASSPDASPFRLRSRCVASTKRATTQGSRCRPKSS
jgi:molecular chaperone DnaK (HSP70)